MNRFKICPNFISDGTFCKVLITLSRIILTFQNYLSVCILLFFVHISTKTNLAAFPDIMFGYI